VAFGLLTFSTLITSPFVKNLALGQPPLISEMQSYEASSASDGSYTVNSQSSSPNGSISDYSLSPNHLSNAQMDTIASDSEYSAGPRRESMNIRNLLN
jgi:hypothetical protein